MKISARTVLKIARLHNLADDNTSVKDLKNLRTNATESLVSAGFTLFKAQYMLFFGLELEPEDIRQL